MTTRILVIEDNPVDVKALLYAFAQYPEWRTKFDVIDDGEKAVEYLLSSATAKPDLIILDLNLPKWDGMEVLQAIRNAEVTRYVPVIVFSSSPEDAIRSKMVQANLSVEGYVTKPLGLDLFMDLPGQFRECLGARDKMDELDRDLSAVSDG